MQAEVSSIESLFGGLCAGPEKINALQLEEFLQEREM